jgi:RNA polymerase sigma-70 factor, ECF subfamily
MSAEVAVEVTFGGLREPTQPVILHLTVGLQPGSRRRGRAVDRELVLRAQRGEESAFASLLQRHGDRLHATAHHILRDSDLAADAVQLAMIEMWRKLPNLREPDAFKGWAYRIVVRAALAEAKGRSTWRIRVAPVDVEGQAGVDEGHRIEDRDELERGLARLTLEQRTVVVLKHYAGLSNDEISEVLGVPEGTIRSRLHYAMSSMRAAVEAGRRLAVGAEP